MGDLYISCYLSRLSPTTYSREISSFSIKSYKVGRLIPSSAAAELIRPRLRFNARWTISRSTFSRASFSVVEEEKPNPVDSSRSFSVIRLLSAIMTARLIRLCNSRTFPGQGWRLIARKVWHKGDVSLAVLGGVLLQK